MIIITGNIAIENIVLKKGEIKCDDNKNKKNW